MSQVAKTTFKSRCRKDFLTIGAMKLLHENPLAKFNFSKIKCLQHASIHE